MNIESKTTLFIVALVMLVLSSVTVMGYVLISQHMQVQVAEDLQRAQRVFSEAQKDDFSRMLTTARSISKEPALIAAALTGDHPTIEGMLEDLFSRPGVDLIAVHLDTGPSGVVAEGSKPHFTSRQTLTSAPMQELVAHITHGENQAVANVLIFDSLLRMAAVPIESPLGGRIGVLVIGVETGPETVHQLQQLVRADLAIYSPQVVHGASDALSKLDAKALAAGHDDSRVFKFNNGTESFYGANYPIMGALAQRPIAQVLFAYSSDARWAPYRELARSAGIFSLLIMLLAAWLGIAISRNTLTKPIKHLVDATRAISAGDLTIKVGEENQDELGELARSFNHMLLQLNTSYRETTDSEQRFHDFAASSSDWLWETDANGRFSYVSPGVTETLEFSPEELVGQSLVEIFPGDNVARIMGVLRSMLGEPQAFMDVEVWVSAREGQPSCLSMNGIPVLHEGVFHGYRGTSKDVTAAKRDEERLVYLANQDHLTGLANRRSFMEDLEREVRRSERHQHQGALMLLDLDHFKLINDTAGHAAGDDVIVQVATLLRRMARNEDLIARLSGDEFALSFPDISTEQVLVRGRQILEQIALLKPRHDGKARNITASVGVVVFPDHGHDIVDLLAKADTAMYSAKDAGRNQVHLFSEGDRAQERMGSQLTWKERIHQALEDDMFMLAYQPIVATSGTSAQRFEVLVRMLDSKGKVHMPGNFIPTAEQFGLIRDVDKVIVKKALRELAKLPVNGEPIGFSINLSGLSIGEPQMLELIASELAANALDPGRVTFEITETAACENMGRAIEFINQIRALGCRIALDDFGVGFSSFSYLKHIRADMIKIDGSFIRNIHTSREDQLFVKALVDVAQGLGITTTAEFVESAEVLEKVRGLGVSYAQGYYVGRPLNSILHEVSPVRLAAG